MLDHVGARSQLVSLSIAWAASTRGTGPSTRKGSLLLRLVDALLEKGIKPNASFHWDLPEALDDRGGWLNRDISDCSAIRRTISTPWVTASRCGPRSTSRGSSRRRLSVGVLAPASNLFDRRRHAQPAPRSWQCRERFRSTKARKKGDRNRRQPGPSIRRPISGGSGCGRRADAYMTGNTSIRFPRKYPAECGDFWRGVAEWRTKSHAPHQTAHRFSA